jgi:hypothetical protein
MKILKVPYAQKDQAKALGARWNNERKTWYVPDGQPSAPFEQWLLPGQQDQAGSATGAATGKQRLDAYAGEPVLGAHYLELPHDCNPFTECAACRPLLERSGWKAAHEQTAALLQSLGGSRHS